MEIEHPAAGAQLDQHIQEPNIQIDNYFEISYSVKAKL